MACPQKRNALKVLLGELEGSASAKMLQHCRVCGECREAFDFAAATITRTAEGAGVMITRATEPSEEAAASLDGNVTRMPFAKKRNRRTLIIFGAVACALLLAGIGSGRRVEAGDPADVIEARWKRAIGDGTSVVQSPIGAFCERPRVVTGLVPPGSSAFVLTFFDDSGAVVLQRGAKPGERGCFVEEAEISASGVTFKAGRFVAPFPEPAALPLAPGRPYGAVIAIAGGHASASSVFQITPPDAALHGGVEEER